MKHFLVFCLVLIFAFPQTGQGQAILSFVSDGHLKAAEMNVGDEIRFRKKDKSEFRLVLKGTSARRVFTFENPKNTWQSGCIYAMECDLEINGQPMHLTRFVSAQQSFYEPWHINGVTLFFDAVKKIDSFINDNHGGTVANNDLTFPTKDARFAFVEYEGEFASQELKAWFPVKENRFRIEDSYDGGDVWLGGFKKDEAHSGLDINVPNNTPLWAPIDFDNQYYFNSLAKGDNNNRWLGTRKWKNGETWTLRSHHMTELKVPENTPVLQGTEYGEIGGTYYGGHPHAHFFFQWKKDSTVVKLDPWILFWKIFETRKKNAQAIRAVMNPLHPAKTGETIELSAVKSQPGTGGGKLKYFWSINDGRFYKGAVCRPRLLKPGMLGITLLVTNGCDSARVTQFVSVGEGNLHDPWLRLEPLDLFDLPVCHSGETEIYGFQERPAGNFVSFYLRKNGRFDPAPKQIRVLGDPASLQRLSAKTEYLDGGNWLSAVFDKDLLTLRILPKELDKARGTYQARIRIVSGTGTDQLLLVQVHSPDHRWAPSDRVVVDDEEAQFFPSPFYWVRNGYEHDFLRGYNGSFRVWAGGDSIRGIARYQPDLKAGRYRISIPEGSVTKPKFSLEEVGIWDVRIMGANGQETREWNFDQTPVLGEFNLKGGKESWVDFQTKGKNGLLCIDGLVFERIGD